MMKKIEVDIDMLVMSLENSTSELGEFLLDQETGEILIQETQ